MTKKIYLETFEKCPGSVYFPLLKTIKNKKNTKKKKRKKFKNFLSTAWKMGNSLINLIVIYRHGPDRKVFSATTISTNNTYQIPLITTPSGKWACCHLYLYQDLSQSTEKCLPVFSDGRYVEMFQRSCCKPHLNLKVCF